MAYKCENCQKGVEIGHMVSHAKNRLRRLFRPNLQKLKVLTGGVEIRVKFCASCIKRLKKDGRIGAFAVIKRGVSFFEEKSVLKSVLKNVEKKPQKQLKEQKPQETLDISSIVGTKK